MALASVRMGTDLIETGFHQNRALLIAFAIGTTVLILAGSYLIIRYVIVKPVKHLKDVADAIAAGDGERAARLIEDHGLRASQQFGERLDQVLKSTLIPGDKP